MAHFSIISSQGQHPVIFTGAPRYVGAYLKPGYLEFPEIGSPTAIGWHVGDYVVYSRTGRTYRLYGTPKATEQSEANKFGAAFLYENVQFFDDMKQWELCPFTDLVPGDNTVHFSTQGVVSFFGKPSNVAERLQACLENQYGTGSWEVRIVDTSDADLLEILNTEVEFSVSGVNCLQVLDKVYDTWNKLGWAYTIENGKNILTIGAPNDRTAANTTEGYSYDNGLVAVEKSIANAAEIGTRLFAYGSMKNMDATYYRGLDIYQAESVDIEHLMIPISYWGTTSSKPDARKAYIQDASAIAKMGVIPRTAYFDGTGDLPDIHPTIERMTIGEVYDAGGAGYLPDLSKWSRNQRIDEIISANNPSDEGAASDMGVRFKESISGTLDAVTEVGPANEYIEPDIFTTTLTKSGRLVLKFGRNAQTITINSAWDARFNVATLEVSNGSNLEAVPLKIEPVSSTSFTFVLPEQVVIQNAVAGTLRVGLNIFVLDNAPTAQTDTVTIGMDGTTTIEGGVVYMLDKTFSVTIPQIGFDIEKYAELGNGKKISMKTGMCAGRDFEIRDLSYQSSTDSWLLTLYRSNDEDLNILFPNVDYPIAAGDQFVLLDIAMPEMYVTVASQRLLEAAQKLLADISEEKPFYAPQIDAKKVIDESRILLEGLWMDISFNGAQEYALIDSITIDENGSNIPTYEVALRQEKGLDWTENIGSASSGKSSVSVSGNESIDPKGTVTSVGLTAPAGMEVEGSPVTGAGILELKLAQGYKIPLISELVNYFEQDGDIPGLIKLKSAYNYLGPRKGMIFEPTAESDVADSPAHLMLRNFGTSEDPNYALYTPYAIVSAKDQVVISGTPGGGGGGGGATFLPDLEDVSDDLYAPTAGMVLQYSGSQWVGNLPATQIGANVTGLTTGALIYGVLGDGFNPNWTVKDFINSSISTATAEYRGSYNEKTDLNLNPSATRAQVATKLGTVISVADDNDYCFVEIPTSSSTPTEIARTERYKYNGTSWAYEYTLNNSGFTSEQWASINSGITSGKVSSYDTIAGYFSGGKILSTALPAMYIGTTAVRFTGATQDLTGIGNISMSGNITIPNGNAILAASSFSMLAVSSAGTVFYCGPGYEISAGFLLRSGDINLIHRKYTAANTYHDYAIWDSSNATISDAALTLGHASLGTSSTPIGYSTYNRRFRRFVGSSAAGGYDLDTLLAGGGITSQYSSVSYWANGPSGMSYGGAVQIVPTDSADNLLAMQLAWDVDHTNAKTGKLWWRDRNNSGGTPGWGEWHLLYDSANANLSTVDWNCKDLHAYGVATIGTATAATGATLTVDGAIASSGDQVITSDIRMKTHLKPIKLSVEQIAKCRAVTFDWTAGGHSFGSIAQDWQDILPEAVHDGKTLSLAYAQLGTVIGITLAKHETEQDKEIRELKEEVKNLKAEVKRLRAN